MGVIHVVRSSSCLLFIFLGFGFLDRFAFYLSFISLPISLFPDIFPPFLLLYLDSLARARARSFVRLPCGEGSGVVAFGVALRCDLLCGIGVGNENGADF
jgi:hypothetical protein